MQIEKEKIQEAKEKLGDRNEELIVELLGLEDYGYDSRSHKCKCVKHSEDTASFIYNPKSFSFHCFGCGVNIDLVDALIEKTGSFPEAAKKLFEYANIDYNFGEIGVKTDRKYRYPKDDSCGNNDIVYEYLKKRGISKETADYLEMDHDGKGNIMFKYYDLNNILCNVKYRPARKIDKSKGDIKNWFQKDADSKPLLYNMNRINTSQPLLICEGECDCAAAITAGFLNSVSVPTGATNFKWIEDNFEWLEQFSELISAGDMDDAGRKMNEEVKRRLGSWRVKVVEHPKDTKDLNEILYKYGKAELLNIILGAKESPVKSVTDFSDIDDIDIADLEGIPTGIKAIDDVIIKLFYGTLTILSGRPSSGKSSFMNSCIANAIDNGIHTFLYSAEMPQATTTNWLYTLIAGNRHLKEVKKKDGSTFKVVKSEAKKAIKEYYRSSLFIYNDNESNNVNDVMESMEECVRKYSCRLIILDNLMTLDLNCKEEETNTAQKDFVNNLIQFARRFGVAVVLIAHPRKTQDMTSDINMYDVAGTSAIANLCMRSIGLRRISKKEQEDEKSKFGKYQVCAVINKDRMLGRSDVRIGLYYCNESRRFYTTYDEYDKVYSWDTNKYTDKIECPVDFGEEPFE